MVASSDLRGQTVCCPSIDLISRQSPPRHSFGGNRGMPKKKKSSKKAAAGGDVKNKDGNFPPFVPLEEVELKRDVELAAAPTRAVSMSERCHRFTFRICVCVCV